MLIILLLLSPQLFAQKEAFNWTFGEGALLQFHEDSKPTLTLNSSSINTREGCATFSDQKGKLLLYTDGITVWDGENNVVVEGLLGDHSSTQSGVIVQHPNSDEIFVFTAPVGQYFDHMNPDSNKGLRYNILKKEDDTYSILKKNELLVRPVTENVTAVEHANEKDMWIITKKANSKSYYSFLLTENGIEKNYESQTGNIYSYFGESSIGYLKASPDGTMIANSSYSEGYLEIFDFNNRTGQIKKTFDLSNDLTQNIYGLEFSPDSKFLYATTTTNDTTLLIQYDLGNPENNEEIIASAKLMRQIVVDDESFGFGTLQLGPDGKIYVVDQTNQTLDIIQQPNYEFPFCNYERGEQNIFNGHLYLGLPNFAQSYFKSELIIDSLFACEKERIFIDGSLRMKSEIDSLKWWGPNEFSSDQEDVLIDDANIYNEGWYFYEIFFRGESRLDSIFVKVNPSPKAKLSDGDLTICGDELIVSAEPNENYTYSWSNGDVGIYTIINEPGEYFLIAQNESYCSDTLYFEVDKAFNEITIPVEQQDFSANCRNFESKANVIIIQNSTELKFQITELFNSNDKIEFTKNISGEILPDSIISVNADFSKIQTPGIYYDTLSIYTSNDCLYKIDVPVKYTLEADVDFSINEHKIDAGKTNYEIPISIIPACPTHDYRGSLSFDIEYDNTVISIDSSKNSVFSIENTENGKGFATLEINDFDIKNNDVSIFVSTYLSSVKFTDLVISNAEWDDDYINSFYNQGKVEITGVCIHETRAISINPNIEFLSISPKPAQESINIKVNSKSDFNLSIVNSVGTKIYELNHNLSKNCIENIEFKVDISNYANGFYIISVRTDDKLLYDKFLKTH